MKHDPRKCFGYPVLRYPAPSPGMGGRDYEGASFQVIIQPTLDVTRTPEKISIDYRVNLSLMALQDKFSTGEIARFLRVECRDTYLTMTEEVSDSGRLLIDAGNLRGRVEVSAFILAKKETEIVSDSINPEFGGDRFVAKAGQVLALSEPVVFCADRDVQRRLRSIFEFDPKDHLMKGEFRVNLDKQYVYIESCPEQEQELKRALKSGSGEAVFDSSVALSAVILMLTKLQNKDTAGDYANYKWAQVVQSKYPRLLNSDSDALAGAQEILDRPLGRLNAVLESIREK